MNEHDIRNFLISYLAQRFESEQPKFLKEVFLNNYECRADLIMVGKNLHGFEIKSEIDTLKRLVLQIPHYENSFEKVTIVCATKHAQKALALIPNHFGLWIISNNKIQIIRNAKKKEMNKEQLLTHLPVYELKNLLSHMNLKKSGNRNQLISRCLKQVNKSSVRDCVIHRLKQRAEERYIKKDKSSSIAYQACNLSQLSANFFLQEINTVLPRKTAKNPTPHPLRLELDLVC